MYVGIVFILGYMLTQSMCKVQCTEQTLSKEFSYRLVKICCSHNFIFLCDVSTEHVYKAIDILSFFGNPGLDTCTVRYIHSFFQMNSKFGLYFCEYFIQLCFICRPSDFTVSWGCWDRTQDSCGVRIDSQSCYHPLGNISSTHGCPVSSTFRTP
jgi:hypothetical protein